MLPAPDQNDRERSCALQEIIYEKIRANRGVLSFQDYMHLCLYTIDLGYYTAKHQIFGESGDFVTSSEQTNLFALAFVNHLQKVKKLLPEFKLIEIGAGSGRFAAQILSLLKSEQQLPDQYYIVEPSDSLRIQQQELINKILGADAQIVEWITKFDSSIDQAVVIANEVLDALPVRLLTIDNHKIFERCVEINSAGELGFVCIDASENLKKIARQRIPETVIQNADIIYNTEICTLLPSFIAEIADSVEQGVLFFIDYGYPQREYYDVQRTMGTLLCHYRHQAHDDPLNWPGLQDISCNVDFSALASAGEQADLTLAGYSTQAHFLLASNILEKMSSVEFEQQLWYESSQLKQLVMPAEMGERFQVMMFTKQLTLDAEQFCIRDLRYRL